MTNPYTPEILFATSKIVSSIISSSNLVVKSENLEGLIETVFRKIKTLCSEAVELIPAVPKEESVKADYIVCLEDGAKLKMLKRYLRSKFNLTPDEYREKWGLDKSYPMTCKSHSKKRSSLAKKMGLGKRKRENIG